MKRRTQTVTMLAFAVLWPGLLVAQPGSTKPAIDLDQRVFVDLNQVPPVTLLRQLAAAVGCKLEIEGSLPESAVSLRLSNVRARTALDAACDTVGCRWRVEGQSLHVEVTAPPPALTSGQSFIEKLATPLRGEGWNIERVPLGDVLALLSKELGVQVVVDNADPSTVISVDLRGRSPNEAFSFVQRALGWNRVSLPGRTYSLSSGSGPMPLKPQVIHLTGRKDPNADTGAAAAIPQVFEKGEPGITMPRVVRDAKPQYTREALDARIKGTVVLSCVVDPGGNVTDIRIVQPLDPGLDDQAIEALRRWRFMPGLKDGKPVPVRVTMEMTFTLK